MQICVHLIHAPLITDRVSFETEYLGVVLVCHQCAWILRKRLVNIGEQKPVSLEFPIEGPLEAA